MICRVVGTVFVDRERRRALPEVMAAVDAAVAQGRTVVVFPEGTSTGGSHVLPFKPSLLEAAARAGWRVGWAALRYRTPEGEPPASEVVCWWREMTLLPHFARLRYRNSRRAHLRAGAPGRFRSQASGEPARHAVQEQVVPQVQAETST